MRKWIATAMLVGLAVLATTASAPASDIYITAKVVGRIAGTNVSRVEITWAYKCLGDKLGNATYDWTLKVERSTPRPKKTTTVGHGTSKRGSDTIALGPGEYLPFSDPYSCETERGAGYDQPEIGAPFSVLDYCGWSVSSLRGAVELEQGAAVKAAKRGAVAAPGDALVTPKGGAATAKTLGGEGTATLSANTRLEVDKKQCPAKGGWLLRLASGSVIMQVGAAFDAKRVYRVATPNATATGTKAARWRVKFAKRKTTVRALAGRVRVAGSKRSPVTLKAGQSTSVG